MRDCKRTAVSDERRVPRLAARSAMECDSEAAAFLTASRRATALDQRQTSYTAWLVAEQGRKRLPFPPYTYFVGQAISAWPMVAPPIVSE